MTRILHYCYGYRTPKRIHVKLACIMLLIAKIFVEKQFLLTVEVSSALFVHADSSIEMNAQAMSLPSPLPTSITLKNAWWNKPTYPPTLLVRSNMPSITASTSSPVDRVESLSPTMDSTDSSSLAAPTTPGQTETPTMLIPTVFPSAITTSPTSVAPSFKPSTSSSQAVTSSSPTTEMPSYIPTYAPTSAQLGDGWCDTGDLNLPDLNTAECNYDGGDCCLATCNSDKPFACGTAGFDCINPNYASQMRSSNFTLLFLIANFSLVPSDSGSTPDEKATEVALSAFTYIAIEQQPREFLGPPSSEEVSVISRISTVLTSFEDRLVGDVKVVITTYFNSTMNSSSFQQRRLQQEKDESYVPTTVEFNLQRSLRYAARVLVLPSLTNVIVCSNRTAAVCITRAEPVAFVVQPNDDSANASVCTRSEGMWRMWYGSPRFFPAYLLLLIFFSAMWAVIILVLFACLTLLLRMWGKGLSVTQVIRNLAWVVLSVAAVLRFLCNIWILGEADIFAGAYDVDRLQAAACYEFAYLGPNNEKGIDVINTDTLPLYILALTLFYCVFAIVSLLRSLQRVMEQNMSFERQRGYFANLFITSLLLCILILLNVISAILWAAGVYSSRSSVVMVIVALTQAICGIVIMLHSLATGSAESAVLCAIGVLYIVTSYPDVVKDASTAFWLSSLLCRALEILWAVLYLNSVLSIRQVGKQGNGFAPTVIHAVPVLKNNSTLQNKRNWQRQRMARYALVSDRIIDDLEECNHPEWIQEWIAQEEEKDVFARA